MSRENATKRRTFELGPLNLAKTQYRPYLSSPNKRSSENLLWMGPLGNVMVDIPPFEEAHNAIELSTAHKLRSEVGKMFEKKESKSKEQWMFYINKADLVTTANSSWKEIECYLLKIICELSSECEYLNFQNLELKKEKHNINDKQNSTLKKTKYQIKLTEKSTTASKENNKINDYSINTDFNLSKVDHRFAKLKTIGPSEPKENSISALEDKTTYILSKNMSKNGENNYEFIISKLEKEICLYKEKIQNIEEEHNKRMKDMEKRIQIEMEVKFYETKQQKMKFESEVESKKIHNDILAQEFKILKTKYAVLESEYNKIKDELIGAEEAKKKLSKMNEFRELWLMEHEESFQKGQELIKTREEKENEVKKNKGLKQKLKELSKSFNYNYNSSMDNEKDKEDLYNVLRDFREWLKFFSVQRISKGMMDNNTFFPEMTIENKESYTSLLPKDDETNYKLLRPNFFIYFEAYEGIIMAEKKFPQRKVLQPEFYLKMRAIFDSMFLHLNFSSDYKTWHNFPEFAISYIEKFEIDCETKIPTLRKSACQSEEKINFLLNVFNMEAANSWECEIFRSFLLEESTLDEVFFYLDCRDTLLRGSHLNNNFGSSDPITYIRFSIAEEMMKDKLKNYDNEMIERIKKFLHSKKKLKNNKDFVDLNFVLKLLLEVYGIEKIKSERFFHQNFKNKPANVKISFTEYSSFMAKNFYFLSKTDIATLFKEMYALAASHITYKTIHHVCSIKGLFIPLLQSKMCLKQESESQTAKNHLWEDIIYSDLQSSLNGMISEIEDYGLEEIAGIEGTMNKFLFETDGLRSNKNVFYSRLLQESQKILKARLILSWKNQRTSVYEEVTKDEIREKLGEILKIVKQSKDDVIRMKKWKENRSRATEKLKRNFKIRIQQSIAEFKGIEDKLANNNKHEQEKA